MNESYFIDDLQNQICVKIKALSEITEYIDTLERSDDINHPINTIPNLFFPN